MTDQTAARDHAIEVLTTGVRYWTEDPDRCDMEYREEEVAHHLVDALLARPEVLRALAGAPTADVADLPARFRRAADVAGRAEVSREKLRDFAEWLEILPPHVVGDIGRVLAAAPEGVDAADEQAALLACVDELKRDRHQLRAERDGLVGTLREMRKAHAELFLLRAGRWGNQRARELHWPADSSPDAAIHCHECVEVWPCPTVRALDGDTTEEGR